MVWNAKRLLKDGFLKAPIHFQCCMHVYGGMEGNARNLVHLVDSLPEGSTWSAFGCGPTADLITAMAINMGGHVRVGMEDNVYLSKGVLAKHNYEFVEKVQRLADEFKRPVATRGRGPADPGTAAQEVRCQTAGRLCRPAVPHSPRVVRPPGRI